eukprot:g14417.t1
MFLLECDVLEGVVLVGKVARSTSRTPWWASLSNTHTRSPNRLGMERVSSMGSSAHLQPATQSVTPLGDGVEWMPMSSDMQC